MERMKLKEFVDEYLLSGRYVCVSGRTGKRLCSSSNTRAYREKFSGREVLTIRLYTAVENGLAYPMMKIWISDYNHIQTKDENSK